MFLRHPRRGHSSVKAGSSCFYRCGSSAMLRLGFLTESKSEDNKIATDFPAAPICARGGIGRHDGFRCCHLGERFFRGSSPRTFFGKSRLACFYKRGSSVTLRHGFPRRVKTEDNKIAAGIPAAHICGYGGNGRLGGFRCCHLGERFLRHPRRGHSSVKAGSPVFIAAGQALRSASVSSPSQDQRAAK